MTAPHREKTADTQESSGNISLGCSTRGYSRWVWTELLAFDVTSRDYGISDYFLTLGFVPDGISLLISTPDFILQHEGLAVDSDLPPDVCSRNGQEGNERRSRQIWKKSQLRSLVTALREAGCQVFLSNFTHYLRNRFHYEWLSDHPEAMTVSAPEGRRDALFVLARLADGTYVQDFFARQLARVCQDYGFDGWHGADGYGPQWAIYKFGCSDDFVRQFSERLAQPLPDFVTQPCEDQPETLQKRMDWIWANRRLEWIEFYSDRWAEFWQTVMEALRACGRKAMINSAWTKAPFEAKYRYGVDYRKIAATGVHAMMVETAAGGMQIGSRHRNFHYDFLAMLMFIRVCAPRLEILFLHNIKDVEENWDTLRHAPAMLEREVYALANAYSINASGEIARCADGFLGCLADGISAEEWSWLRDRWALAYEVLPKALLGAVVLWSDSHLDGQLRDFPLRRQPSAHYLAYQLMEHNAPIPAIARLEVIEKLGNPVLVLNPHFLSREEKERVLNYPHGAILIGPDFTGWPECSFEYGSVGMGLRLYGLNFQGDLPEPESIVSSEAMDASSVREPIPFRAELSYSTSIPVSFWRSCAKIIQNVCGLPLSLAFEELGIHQQSEGLIGSPPPDASLMVMQLSDDVLRVAIKNSDSIYAWLNLRSVNPLSGIAVRTPFPVNRIKPTEEVLPVVVPPMGIAVLDLTIQSRKI